MPSHTGCSPRGAGALVLLLRITSPRVPCGKLRSPLQAREPPRRNVMKTRIAFPFAVIAFACVMGVVPMAEGTPVVYSEFVSGDVDGHSFTFGIGINSISGDFNAGCLDPFSFGCLEPLNPDRFGFSLPAHTELVAITSSFHLSGRMSFSLSGQSLDDGSVSGTISYDACSSRSSLSVSRASPPCPGGPAPMMCKVATVLPPTARTPRVGSIVNTTWISQWLGLQSPNLLRISCSSASASPG